MSETQTFEKILETKGKLIYTNKGISMMPLLREDKDIMVIQSIKGVDCKKLDVVLFIRPGVEGRGKYVLHRILKKRSNDNFWIVGDNCLSGENVKPEQIIGKLTSVIRDGKIIDSTNWKYQLYVQTWCRFWRVRILILKMKGSIKNVLRFIKTLLVDK